MSDNNKPSLRIDWFDGTVIEDTKPNTSQPVSDYADEEAPTSKQNAKPQYTEKKSIGFKRLYDLSTLKPPILNLEVSNRPGFWNLLDEDELKGDFIVLIVSILANVYKSLELGERSKMVTMLRKRFHKSKFLEHLKNYLNELPSVRIVEKRMNSQMWDDAEGFFNNVLYLCECAIDFEVDNLEFMKELLDVLEITEISAVGVKEEHSERFSDDLFAKIEVLKCKAMSLLEKEDPVKLEHNQKTDKNYFKNLNIFPNKADLLSISQVDIKPHIINGAYPSVEHYLDIQFKLLREDCFGPLREGISKYLQNPTKRRHENIRVYPNVRVLRTFVSNNKVGHLVDIAWKDRVSQGTVDAKKYATNKQLMFGSLLLFTSQNFETILCATVLDSNQQLLREGYVAVSFQSPVSNSIFTELHLMVESEVFFEPYHRVLKVLQESRIDDLPMRRYIIDLQNKTNPPAYLNCETIYTLPHKTEEIPFHVLGTEEWPTTLFNLDTSQLEAYKYALTREFAVIQGPPGTGKTYIGVKIASTLLRNLSLEGTPMLIICYTNHALDQFLEGILDVTDSIVRLGSQSKSALLEKYTLHNLRMKIKSKYSYLFASKRSELESIYKQMMEVQSEIEKCEKEIICYKSLKPNLKINDKNYELKTGKEDAVIGWLFDHLRDGLETELEDDEQEDWEKLDELIVSDELETCFSEKWAQKEIDSMLNSIKYLRDVSDEHFEGEKMTDRFENQISKVRKRLNCFKKMSALLRNDSKQNNELENIKDLISLSTEQRWRVYYSAVNRIIDDLMIKMNKLLDEHKTANDELNEISTLIDGEVMKSVRVVGLTTTTAARRHDLMKRLASPIVIVEEAAEVLEGHIVASLTPRCQHLILIGDHKQLRPTAAHYKLAKDYNLEISLFERMIRNKVHARTLSTQRRMRPQFVRLIVPAIYDALDCHPCVNNYKDVIGMRDNLYFFNHDMLEDSEGLEDSWSHKNTYEAKWCLALANYLRQRNYKSEEITILATYTGQVTLLKELCKNYQTLRDVKITAVDNYQGEENRIVILSLVRSNRDGKIGFLSAANRICVALSRAKEGFYIFGNMNILQASSSIWRVIHDRLVEMNAIGKSLVLHCEAHKGNTFDVQQIDDFKNCLATKGTCLRVCEIK